MPISAHTTLEKCPNRAGRRRRPLPVRTGAAICAVAAALACGPLRAADAGAAPPPLELTLREAIEVVLRNNRQLIDARLDRVVDRFSLRLAENTFRPRFSVGPYVRRTGTDADSTGGAGVASTASVAVPTGGEFAVQLSNAAGLGDGFAGARYSNELALTFRQPLLRGAGTRIATAPVRMARVREEIEVLALEQSVIDVVSSVARSYRNVMQAGRRVEIRTESLERAKELLAVNQLLVRTGRMAERDVVQTRADIASREIQLLAVRNALEAARLALTDILDVDSRTEVRLADTLDELREVQPLPIGFEEAVDTALRNRPDHRRAVLGIENAKTRLAVAENAKKWDLSATLSVSFAGDDGSFAGSAGALSRRDYGAWLDLLIPLGRAAKDLQEKDRLAAAVDLRRARNALADLRQRVDIDVGNAIRELELARQQVGLARTARELAQEKTEIERERLRLGLSSNFRLVTFEDDLVAAEDSELNSLITYLDALTSLDRTLGTTLQRWNIAIDEVDRAPAPRAEAGPP